MANEKVVVQGGTLGFQVQTPLVVGSISFLSSPSVKVLAEGNGIYRGTVQFQVAAGCTNGVCTTQSPYTDSFTPQATLTNVDNEKPLRDTDTKSVTMPGLDGSSNPCYIVATVIVNDAGQTKVSCS